MQVGSYSFATPKTHVAFTFEREALLAPASQEGYAEHSLLGDRLGDRLGVRLSPFAGAKW